MTENEMVRWHQQLNRHEFEQTPEDSEGRESLVSCSPNEQQWQADSFIVYFNWKSELFCHFFFLFLLPLKKSDVGQCMFIYLNFFYHGNISTWLFVLKTE